MNGIPTYEGHIDGRNKNHLYSDSSIQRPSLRSLSIFHTHHQIEVAAVG